MNAFIEAIHRYSCIVRKYMRSLLIQISIKKVLILCSTRPTSWNRNAINVRRKRWYCYVTSRQTLINLFAKYRYSQRLLFGMALYSLTLNYLFGSRVIPLYCIHIAEQIFTPDMQLRFRPIMVYHLHDSKVWNADIDKQIVEKLFKVIRIIRDGKVILSIVSSNQQNHWSVRIIL